MQLTEASPNGRHPSIKQTWVSGGGARQREGWHNQSEQAWTVPAPCQVSTQSQVVDAPCSLTLHVGLKVPYEDSAAALCTSNVYLSHLQKI